MREGARRGEFEVRIVHKIDHLVHRLEWFLEVVHELQVLVDSGDDAGKKVRVVYRVDILYEVMDIATNTPRLEILAGVAVIVRQLIYPEGIVVESDCDLAIIIAALVESGIRRLIVVDAENRPVGLISDSDVVSQVQQPERHGVLQALHGGSAPASNGTAQELMSPLVLTASEDTPNRRGSPVNARWPVILTGKLDSLTINRFLAGIVN